MSVISLIAAVSEDHVIGRDNKLPWRIKSDLTNFRKLTLHKPVIMGRKTFDSLGEPLDNRHNIVVTRDPIFAAPGVDVFRSVEEAVAFARDIPADEVMVIGGEQIFEATLSCANRMYLTMIHTVIGDGDAFFPQYNQGDWVKVEERPLLTAPTEYKADFLVLERGRRVA